MSEGGMVVFTSAVSLVGVGIGGLLTWLVSSKASDKQATRDERQRIVERTDQAVEALFAAASDFDGAFADFTDLAKVRTRLIDDGAFDRLSAAELVAKARSSRSHPAFSQLLAGLRELKFLVDADGSPLEGLRLHAACVKMACALWLGDPEALEAEHPTAADLRTIVAKQRPEWVAMVTLPPEQ